MEYGKLASKDLRRGLFLDFEMQRDSGKNAKKRILKGYGIDKKRNEREPGKFLMK